MAIRGYTQFDFTGAFVLLVGCAVLAIALQIFTDLPTWLCLAIALPVGPLATWSLVAAGSYLFIYLIVRPLERRKEKRKRLFRERFNNR